MFIEAGSIPSPIYDVAIGFPDTIPPNSTIITFNVVRPIYLLQHLPGSLFTVGAAPSAAVSLTLQKNGTPIGSIVFSNGGTEGMATFAASINFAADDQLQVTTPSALDGMENFAATLVFGIGMAPA